MHSSGIGKAVLAFMDDDRLTRVLDAAAFEAFTEHTITTAEDLRADLDQTRLRGFAIDNEEKNAGMRCIAAPVFDMNSEVVAGISVSGPISRVAQDQTDRLSRAVIDASRQLTQAIGGIAPVSS